MAIINQAYLFTHKFSYIFLMGVNVQEECFLMAFFLIFFFTPKLLPPAYTTMRRTNDHKRSCNHPLMTAHFQNIVFQSCQFFDVVRTKMIFDHCPTTDHHPILKCFIQSKQNNFFEIVMLWEALNDPVKLVTAHYQLIISSLLAHYTDVVVTVYCNIYSPYR